MASAHSQTAVHSSYLVRHAAVAPLAPRVAPRSLTWPPGLAATCLLLLLQVGRRHPYSVPPSAHAPRARSKGPRTRSRSPTVRNPASSTLARRCGGSAKLMTSWRLAITHSQLLKVTSCGRPCRNSKKPMPDAKNPVALGRCPCLPHVMLFIYISRFVSGSHLERSYAFTGKAV